MSPILGIYASSISPSLNASSYYSIATVTVTSGTQSSITFSSIPQTYKHLEIRSIGHSNSGNYGPGGISAYFNSDTNYAGNYYNHYLEGGSPASGVYSGGGAANSNQKGLSLGYYTGGAANSALMGAGVATILDYSNTNKYKTTRFLGGADFNGTTGSPTSAGYVEYDSGLWMSTAAITSITLTCYSTESFTANTQIALYGIKG